MESREYYGMIGLRAKFKIAKFSEDRTKIIYAFLK